MLALTVWDLDEPAVTVYKSWVDNFVTSDGKLDTVDRKGAYTFAAWLEFFRVAA
jgi:hypothetical protein